MGGDKCLLRVCVYERWSGWIVKCKNPIHSHAKEYISLVCKVSMSRLREEYLDANSLLRDLT